MGKPYIISIDPGREKFGVAVVDFTGENTFLESFSVDDFEKTIVSLLDTYNIKIILLGNGTGHKIFHDKIRNIFNDIKVIIVDERHTTFLAKQLYWEFNRAKGFQRLIPKGLRIINENLDGFAALAIARKWLKNKTDNNDLSNT